MDDYVHLNVGGVSFKTQESTLKKHPNTLLGTLSNRSKYYRQNDNCYAFDRNPELFNTILDFYRNDTVHLPTNYCGWLWKNELSFWGIPITEISSCCYPTFYKYDEQEITAGQLNLAFSQEPVLLPENIDWFGKLRHRIWLIIDEPSSSIWAKLFLFLYLAVVLVSATIPCLSSHPNIRIETRNITVLMRYISTRQLDSWINPDNPKEVLFTTTVEPDWLFNLNLCICVLFTCESLMRFIVCPSKLKFFLEWLNILDLVLNTTMWIRFGIINSNRMDEMLDNMRLTNFFLVCTFLQVLRLLKFFRVAKQYDSLRILFLAVKASLKALFLLLITFLIIAWVFANMIYYAELREPETFQNMLEGLWWAVVTMTTVGYGDMYPIGPFGRLVGATCTMCGLLLLAMPIAVIAGNFSDLYKKNDERENYIKLQANRVGPMINYPPADENKDKRNSNEEPK